MGISCTLLGTLPYALVVVTVVVVAAMVVVFIVGCCCCNCCWEGTLGGASNRGVGKG